MSILILCEDYPSNEKPYAMSYVHSRSTALAKNGEDVRVGSFSALTPYCHDSIPVHPPARLKFSSFDVTFSHAPNLRNHIRLLISLTGKRIVFVIHGHEVLRQFGDYPPPYTWDRCNPLKMAAIKAYDAAKLLAFRCAIKHLSRRNNIGLIFVSEWMREQFARNIGDDILVTSKHTVIPNPINGIFDSRSYRLNDNTLADFVTIRPLDSSKYAIDLIIRHATANPNLTYHIYGRGKFFDYVKKPNNVSVFPRFINQKDIPDLLNHYRYAIMPTRYDSQGVMNCEMANYGIPLITSELPICRETLSEFPNVIFMKEEDFGSQFRIPTKVEGSKYRSPKYDAARLARAELDFAMNL